MEYNPPSGPPPGYSRQQLSSNNPYLNHINNGRQSTENNSRLEDYKPPAGPPPHRSDEYHAPPGPPPSWQKNDEYQPPHGQPPPPTEDEPPPYDPWLAVPDNALLPPPPPMMQDYSPANNASEADAIRARRWCDRNPLWAPRSWDTGALEQIDGRMFSLSAQPDAKSITIKSVRPGHVAVSSTKRQGDTTVMSTLPLYTPQLHGKLAAGQERTISFQVYVKHLSGSDATVAVGFLAPPYPPNRLPGWHRGSLAVHNDDGRRYVNDPDGGIDFVRPFGASEHVGVGMTFTGSQTPHAQPKVRVFFTRNGREEGGWDLHETQDADAGDVSGLDGTTDLYAAVGICGGTELEVTWTV